MSNVLKGVLLNALVFPGTGQLAQKKTLRGWCYIVAAGICVYAVIRLILSQMSHFTDAITQGKIGAEEIGTDTAALTQLITQNIADSGGFAPFAVFGLMLVWLTALIDAIVTGIKLDKAIERD